MKQIHKRLAIVVVGAGAIVALVSSFVLTVVYLWEVPSAVFVRAMPVPLRLAGKSIIKAWQELPYIYYRLWPNNLPVYKIQIIDKDLIKLNNNLPDPFGTLSSNDLKAQPATFIYQGQSYSSKVRYRGETSVHWLSDKKSWRITIKDDNLPEGRRAIDFIVPNGRDFLMEQFNFYRAKKMGLTVPWSELGILKVNGDSQGVFFIVEHWGKEFLEKNNLSADTNFYGESSINQLIWTDTRYWQKYTSNPDEPFDNFSDLQQLLELINNSSDAEFKKNIWQIVDEDNFYAWWTHMILAGSVHQDWAHNIRPYFDRTIGKFQFIPWDVDSGQLAEKGLDRNFNPLISRVVQIPEFKLKRDLLLKAYVDDKKNLADDLAYYDELYAKTRIAFYQDPIKAFSSETFDSEVKRIRNLIKENFDFVKDYLDQAKLNTEIHLNQNGIISSVDIITTNPVPLMLKSFSVSSTPAVDFLVYLDSNNNKKFDVTDRFLGQVQSGVNLILRKPLELRAVMRPKFADPSLYEAYEFLPTFMRLFLAPINYQAIRDLKINLSATNVITERQAKVGFKFFDEGLFADFSRLTLTRQEFLTEHPEFVPDDGQGVTLGPGNYIFNKRVILPVGLKLTINPGTKIYLGQGVSIVAYDSVNLNGATTSPIMFQRLNQGQAWGILAIVGAPEVKIKHAQFEGGTSDVVNGAFFTGMVSIHRVKQVMIDKSSFRRASVQANGDDGVNIKYGKVNITDSVFERNFGDGLDLDFTDGEVRNSVFKDNGNDGLDISGSQLLLADLFISGSGDKGISVGEKSTATVKRAEVTKSNIGIAVKDSSTGELSESKIYGNNIGLSAYNKKPIFGGGEMTIINVVFNDNKKETEIDAKSKIIEQ